MVSRTVANVNRVKDLVHADHWLTVRMIGTIESHHRSSDLTNELGMRKICSKLVPRNLMQDQKDMRRDKCADFCNQLKMIPIF